jgi:hypothetical protein
MFSRVYYSRLGAGDGLDLADRPARMIASNTDMPCSTSSMATGYGRSSRIARAIGELGV